MTQGVTRDKAKLLLGATAVTFTLLGTVTGQVRAFILDGPWPSIGALAMLAVLVVGHFVRALVLSLAAVTQETQHIVPSRTWALVLTDEATDDGAAHAHLAGEILAAAVRTHKAILERVNLVILAETSLKWALILSPLLYVASAMAAGYEEQRVALRRDADLVVLEQALTTEIAALKSSASDLAARLHALQSQDGALQDDVYRGLMTLDQRLTTLERQATLRSRGARHKRRGRRK